MKKTVSCLSLLVLMLFAATAYGAQTTVSVVVGSQTLGVNGIVVDGRTLLPVRDIAEALGATVGWDNNGGKVTISKPVVTIGSAANTIYGETRTVAMAVGSDKVYVNGIESGTLDVPAQVIDGKTMVPVRAVSTWFEATVKWSKEDNTVYITPALNGSLDEAVLNKELIAGKERQVMDQMNEIDESVTVDWIDYEVLSSQGITIKNSLLESDYDAWYTFMRLGGTVEEAQGKWGFYKEDKSIGHNSYPKLFLALPDMTSEFMKMENGEGVFGGIRMYKEQGNTFLKMEDLIAKGILPEKAKYTLAIYASK